MPSSDCKRDELGEGSEDAEGVATKVDEVEGVTHGRLRGLVHASAMVFFFGSFLLLLRLRLRLLLLRLLLLLLRRPASAAAAASARGLMDDLTVGFWTSR